MFKPTASLFSLLLIPICLMSQIQKKEQDFDLIYSEEKIAPYVLPELLELEEGGLVESSADWMNKRRPQILALFSNLIYGRIPHPEFPLETNYKKLKSDQNYLRGKAERRTVQISFRNQRSEAKMKSLLILPKNPQKPVPILMMLSFDRIDSEKMNLNDAGDTFRNGVPIQQLIDQGYGFMAVYQQDLIAHNEVEFRRGIHQLFFREGQSFPKANEWGVLAVISWSAMKALDYLESLPEVDATKVALMGHSKLGKASLWAAAQDERFTMVISAQSGCGGAALWRRKFGETLAKISIFPHWLCGNSRKFINQEDDLPLDQHMLLALIAPRALYVSSALDDSWADPKGEFLSTFHASELYKLLSAGGLREKKIPLPSEPVIEGKVGYHIRPGGHSVNAYDWEQYLKFMNKEFKN